MDEPRACNAEVRPHTEADRHGLGDAATPPQAVGQDSPSRSSIARTACLRPRRSVDLSDVRVVTLAAARASRQKRFRAVSICRRPVRIVFTATVRWQPSSRAA